MSLVEYCPDLTFDLKVEMSGLMIFSSDRDFTLRPTPGTKLTINLDETSITLPIVGGQDAFAKALVEEEKED